MSRIQGASSAPAASSPVEVPTAIANEEEQFPEIEEEKEPSPPETDLPLEQKLKSNDRGLLEKYIQLEKIRAVSSKKAGDITGASEALKAVKALQARVEELDNGAMPSNNLIKEYKKQAIEAKRSGNVEKARELMTKIVQMEQQQQLPQPQSLPKPVAVDRGKALAKAKAKEIIDKLVKQAEECISAAQSHLKGDSKDKASMFVSRKKAFETDAMAVKNAFTTGKPIPSTRNVKVELPVEIELEGIGEDEFKVIVVGVKQTDSLGRARTKELLKSSDSHYFKVIFEWSGYSTAAEKEKNSALMRIDKGTLHTGTFSFKGVKRDLKGQKFFEYQKVRVELYRLETSFFGSDKRILIGAVQIKLNNLLTQPKHELKLVELLDPNRKSIGLGIDVTMMVRRPMSTKVNEVKTVQWIVIDSLTSGRLFPDGSSAPPLPPPVPINVGKQPTNKGEEDDENGPDLSHIVSYAVMEHELELLARNPASSTDPQLVSRQLALESKRDDLGLRIQMGQLSFEDYLASLQQAIKMAKQKALEFKRAGNLDQARVMMLHVQLMEKEISEAAAAAAEED